MHHSPKQMSNWANWEGSGRLSGVFEEYMEDHIRAIRRSGLVVAALGSLAILGTLPLLVEFLGAPSIDIGVGIGIGVVSGTVVIYGAYRVRRSFPPFAVSTVTDLTVAGTLLMAVFVSPLLFSDTPYRPIEVFRTMVSVGLLTGFLVGYNRAQTEVIRRQAGQLESERGRFEFLNSLLRHDVSNKLLVLRGNAELRLQEGVADEADREAFEAVVEAATDIEHMLDDMEALTEPTGAEDVAQADIASLLEPALETVRLDSMATLETDIDPDLQVAANDPLTSAFRNLVQNAVEHNDAPTVSVTARRVDDAVEVRIADDGRGIPEDRREELFSTGSPGFGLYIVNELIERYDGSIEVSENDPSGTVFTIRLPASDGRERPGDLRDSLVIGVID